ncbi:hypothetical protein T492DRAFT_839885 [Pavlovales sp. CCMP2436]|nr:hypothetical protein T492DRAFT_839885 [Pavlovales sp. CCMP2436]
MQAYIRFALAAAAGRQAGDRPMELRNEEARARSQAVLLSEPSLCRGVSYCAREAASTHGIVHPRFYRTWPSSMEVDKAEEHQRLGAGGAWQEAGRTEGAHRCRMSSSAQDVELRVAQLRAAVARELASVLIRVLVPHPRDCPRSAACCEGSTNLESSASRLASSSCSGSGRNGPASMIAAGCSRWAQCAGDGWPPRPASSEVEAPPSERRRGVQVGREGVPLRGAARQRRRVVRSTTTAGVVRGRGAAV